MDSTNIELLGDANDAKASIVDRSLEPSIVKFCSVYSKYLIKFELESIFTIKAQSEL